MITKKPWNGILIIDEFIVHRQNKVIYEEKNIQNIFHANGQFYFLKILFKHLGAPNNYYLGLDNRTTLNLEDTLDSLDGEPVGKGYIRQNISANNFQINLNQNGNYRVVGPTVTFNATTGSWGPVKNIFLTNASSGVDGYLISSARLAEPITLTPPDSATLKFAFAFSN